MRKDTPMFMYNGEEDTVIPIKTTELTFAYLKDEVYGGSDNLNYQSEAGMAHEISPLAIQKIGEWIMHQMKQ